MRAIRGPGSRAVWRIGSLVGLALAVGNPPTGAQASPIQLNLSSLSSNLQSLLPTTHQVNNWWQSLQNGPKTLYTSAVQGIDGLLTPDSSNQFPGMQRYLTNVAALRAQNPAQFDAQHPRL